MKTEQDVHCGESLARGMDARDAATYISRLTVSEKWQLNELLKSLEQTRQPFPSLRE